MKLLTRENLFVLVVITFIILCFTLIYLIIKSKVPEKEGFASVNMPAVNNANALGSIQAVRTYYDQIYQDAASCDVNIKNKALMRGYGVSDGENPITGADIQCVNKEKEKARIMEKIKIVKEQEKSVDKAYNTYLTSIAQAKQPGSPIERIPPKVALKNLESTKALLHVAEKEVKALKVQKAISDTIQRVCKGYPPEECKSLVAADTAVAISKGLSRSEVTKIAEKAMDSLIKKKTKMVVIPYDKNEAKPSAVLTPYPKCNQVALINCNKKK